MREAIGAGVGVATGGLIGALVDAGMPKDDARGYKTDVKEGKAPVAARVPDEQVTAAREEMDKVE
jgi:hypothetical protein